MATNQPIPFKERSSQGQGVGEGSQVPGKPPPGAPRPPGEVGGHTVQPWEQDRGASTTSTPSSMSSKDVPPPQEGASEAKAAGGGPGLTTTQAPYNKPSSKPAGVGGGTDGGNGEEEGNEDDGVVAEHTGAGASRPDRPPVYAPQQGHEPAPRPPPSHAPTGLGTEGDRLVEAIVKAISENIGKAFHQSVAQAVRDVMPLSGRSIDQGVPAKPAALRSPTLDAARDGPAPLPASSPSFPHAATAPASSGPMRREAAAAGAKRADAGPPAGAEKATAAPESPGPTGSRPTGAEAGQAKGPRPSQYGGTIEAPDQGAIERAKRADGGLAEKADEAKPDGNLV